MICIRQNLHADINNQFIVDNKDFKVVADVWLNAQEVTKYILGCLWQASKKKNCAQKIIYKMSQKT